MRNFQQETLEYLERCGAFIVNDHVVYAAGAHGSRHINKDALFTDPKATHAIAAMMARLIVEWRDQHDRLDVIVGPVVGGAILAQLVAFALAQQGIAVRAAFADKEAGGFELRRGYDQLCAGKNVMVVEDILTTGGSVHKVVDVVNAVGGKVVGVMAIVNPGDVTPAMVGATWLQSLANIKMEIWQPADCPLCRTGVPINTTVGKGREFFAAQSR